MTILFFVINVVKRDRTLGYLSAVKKEHVFTLSPKSLSGSARYANLLR